MSKELEKCERYKCLQYLASKITNELVVSWVTWCEWPIEEEKPFNIPCSMLGCTVPMGIGLAKSLPERKIIALTSDGDVLMELGCLPSLAKENPENLLVIVNDNEMYQIAGKRPTMTESKADLSAMARGAGVEYAKTVRNLNDFKKEVDEGFEKEDCARFIVVKTKGEPFKSIYETSNWWREKHRFINHVEETEGVSILPSSEQDKRYLVFRGSTGPGVPGVHRYMDDQTNN
ncbi:hypothetical protein AKJ38_01880 [candidate division MSBL1 archaeon SCGC-AAA259I14]|uniref:sulfopyruvate decarboxylase n=1 Tax=candidate division MSBL1 archaeon SCGC-AAA259I14 TaxID=1698268 RepID=A0A133USG4_9EURY|nr:hypothetical protein AKJ38_01880 [candidate division MSBL1 archaeon SCGC-AAA259I14]